MTPTYRSSTLAVLLAALTALYPVIPAAAGAQAADGKLKINILEGEGAVNNVKQRAAREVLVEVQDENDRPVAGAVVMFTLPQRGPSGSFVNGGKTVTATTGPDGQARAIVQEINKAKGDMQIRVDASHQGSRASTVITQSNIAAAAGGAGKAALIVLLVAGAAGGAAAAALGGGGGGGGGGPAPTPSPSATITPGTPTVGPPPGQ